MLHVVDLVDDHHDGLIELAQDLRQIAIGRRQFSAAIDQEHDLSGLFQSETGLLQNLRWNNRLVVRDDAAGVN